MLNGYSRPDNMPKIIQAWRDQSFKDICIVAVDNRSFNTEQLLGKQILYPDSALWKADDVWRWTNNNGCPCKFYPALSYTNYKYCIFADDDTIPGKTAIEHLLYYAHQLNDNFATIGQIGRIFSMGIDSKDKRYSTSNKSCHFIASVHLTIRAHLFHTRNLVHALSFRNELACHSEEGQRLSHIHDDFLLNMGIQKQTRRNSYIVSSPHKHQQLIEHDLDDNRGVWKRATHFSERNRMVELSLELGWEPNGNA